MVTTETLCLKWFSLSCIRVQKNELRHFGFVDGGREQLVFLWYL